MSGDKLLLTSAFITGGFILYAKIKYDKHTKNMTKEELDKITFFDFASGLIIPNETEEDVTDTAAAAAAAVVTVTDTTTTTTTTTNTTTTTDSPTITTTTARVDDIPDVYQPDGFSAPIEGGHLAYSESRSGLVSKNVPFLEFSGKSIQGCETKCMDNDMCRGFYLKDGICKLHAVYKQKDLIGIDVNDKNSIDTNTGAQFYERTDAMITTWPDTPPVSNYSNGFHNVMPWGSRIAGNGYKTLTSCLAACDENSDCNQVSATMRDMEAQPYFGSRQTNVCHLFSTENNNTYNVSGGTVYHKASKDVSGFKRIPKFKWNGIDNNPHHSMSIVECADACKSDDGCWMFNYNHKTNKCQRGTSLYGTDDRHDDYSRYTLNT